MLVVKKGKCFIEFNSLVHFNRMPDKYTFKEVNGVTYTGKQVYFSVNNGIPVGRYTRAYIYDPISGYFKLFGEIKFTVGIIEKGKFYCNYVLCEH